MFEIEETVAIEQPIEVVWNFVNDEANDPVWQTTLIEAHRVTDGPLITGSRVREVRRFIGRKIETEWEMTGCEAPTHSSIRSMKAPFAWSGTYTLAETGEGTQFSIALRGDPGGFFRLAEPVVQRMARREMSANLANLKDVLEAIADFVESPVDRVLGCAPDEQDHVGTCQVAR